MTVLTGLPNYPQGNFFEGYGFFSRPKENYSGIKIVRAPMLPRFRSRGWQLALNYLSFALGASIWGLFFCRDKYDLIFVFEVSPITVGIPAIVMKKSSQAPICFWVLDLWPESLLATGMVKSRIIIRPVTRLVRWIYEHCEKILVSSKAFIESVRDKGCPAEDIVYFPNWTENEYGGAESETADVPELPTGFRVVFAGNIGRAQDFGTILRAAERLRKYSDIHWVIIGDGSEMAWVAGQVADKGLGDNFHLFGRYPPECMPAFFDQADALLVSLKSELIFYLTLPGKIQSYMACGKPIVAALDGEGARLIQEAGAGLVCPAENPEMLAETVLNMYHMPAAKRRQMGEAGQRYCAEHFDRNLLLAKLENLLQEMSGNHQEVRGNE